MFSAQNLNLFVQSVAADIKSLTTQLNNLIVSAVTLAQVDARIAQVVGAAPAALDTLSEIATALQAEQSATGAITTALSGKASTADLTAVSGRTSDLEAILAGVPDLVAAYNAARA
jgi:hypothetical protein